MFSCVYSSQAGAWSKITFARHLGWACRLDEYSEERSAHVGNALYSMLKWGNKILKYDLGTREFSVMEPPVMLSREANTHSERIQLAAMEDGQLGLAVLREFTTLYILSTDEEFGWGRTKTIDLEKCGIYVPSAIPPFLIDFAGENSLAFMYAGDNGILSVDIRSVQVKVFYKTACISRIVPYIDFCTPVMSTSLLIQRLKQHLAGGSGDTKICTMTTAAIRKEMRGDMETSRRRTASLDDID